MRKTRGFTLLEMVVVVAVIAILAAILIAVVGRVVDDAREARAKADIKAIHEGVLLLYKDTGRTPFQNVPYPPGGPSTLGAVWEVKPGKLVCGPGSTGATDTINISAAGLIATDGSYNNWKGPYLSSKVQPDPWGKSNCIHYNYTLSESGTLAGTAGTATVSGGKDKKIYATPVGTESAGTLTDDVRMYYKPTQ